MYAALDEPDGVAGLSVLRMSEASLEEKVLELEMGGQYSEATSYYNMAIQSRKEEFSYFQVSGCGAVVTDLSARLPNAPFPTHHRVC